MNPDSAEIVLPPLRQLTGPVAKKWATRTESPLPRKSQPSTLPVASPAEASEPPQPTTHWTAKFFSEMPSWLVSNVIHVVILLLLALIPLHKNVHGPLRILMASSSDAETSDAELMASIEFEVDHSPSPADSLDPVFEPKEILEVQSALPELETTPEIERALTPLSSTVVDSIHTQTNIAGRLQGIFVPDSPGVEGGQSGTPKAVADGFKGRGGALKGDLIKKFGGTDETEEAVRLGLEWLKRNQAYDGSWSHMGGQKVSATSMAMLAFLGAGKTHLEGDYKFTVEKAMRWLLSQQDRNGCFVREAYAQAQATIALCELYGMTQDGRLREPAQLAINFDEDFQHMDGGWRYFGTYSSDMSVTGWYVMALISGKMAGLYVDEGKLRDVHKFLDSVQVNDQPTLLQGYGDPLSFYPGSQYQYLPRAGATRGSYSMTAEALLCRVYLGWDGSDQRVQSGCDYLCTRLIDNDAPGASYYYWYYATTVLHHVGGPQWKKWNDKMRKELPEMQFKAGDQAGSWPMDSNYAVSPVYSTTMAMFCLESYYRHLPLFELAEKQ